MKKTRHTLISYFSQTLVLLLMLSALSVQGQTGHPSLDRLSKKYHAYETIEADFTFHYYRNEGDQAGRSESGTILLDQKSGKYRITTPQQVLISDGTSQWAVIPEADEVQVTQVDRTADGITPFNVFTFFNKGFKHRPLASENTGNKRLEVIELTPEDARKNYTKIILRINASGELHDVTIHDRNKSRYSYRIDRLKANTSLAPQAFVFNPSEFSGLEIVDLR